MATETQEYLEEAAEVLAERIQEAKSNGYGVEDILVGRTKADAVAGIASELALANSPDAKAEEEARRGRKQEERESRMNANVDCSECGKTLPRKDSYETGETFYCPPCAFA